ncbi:MAG: RAMP superfamily CRISPR-associated protein [Chloroflexales bacterium]|jgi:CRISPR/Cas system CSM-associated protein Csm3 (group 7 of RAMP superfamily)
MSTWNDTRQIAVRLVVTGNLKLETPAHLGSGEPGETVDMALLKDASEGRPLLPGTSIAGALRSYLRAYERGDFGAELKSGAAALLFGATKGDDEGKHGDEGEQSPLIVDDALGQPITSEVRDGVRIDPVTRTAKDNFKFDIELLPPGTIFPLRFELLLPDDKAKAEKLKAALFLALHGLAQGEIPIGARKTRGFGRCSVSEWTTTTHRLRESRSDLLAWLAADHSAWGYALTSEQIQPQKAEKVPGAGSQQKDQRKRFTIRATFALESPLLIRSEEPLTNSGNQPDVAHLRDGEKHPIISGTSLAGALRARAGRILSAIGHPKHDTFLEGMFGKDMQHDPKNPTASHLIVHEARINAGKALVQNRVSIDRFTGGAFDTALFGEAPHVGGTVTLTLTLCAPKDAEKGLLMLLLKDLWTSDLPLGGTTSIGRGRLRGTSAKICDEGKEWEIKVEGTESNRLQLPDEARTRLESYVGTLAKEGSYAQ